jgi:hypothetical protein
MVEQVCSLIVKAACGGMCVVMVRGIQQFVRSEIYREAVLDLVPSPLPLSRWIFSLQQQPDEPNLLCISWRRPSTGQDGLSLIAFLRFFKRPFDPISNISPWQSCARVTKQRRQIIT